MACGFLIIWKHIPISEMKAVMAQCHAVFTKIAWDANLKADWHFTLESLGEISVILFY